MLLHRLALVPILCAAMLAPRAGAFQEPATPPTQADASAAAKFSAEQLEQIAAPIALYPDKVLAQVLMASTYPLEVVEAARWVDKNPKLTGESLETALKDQDWDPSVKALCSFAPALKKMNEDLDWTQDLGDAFLGDAFLAQREELMDAIQRMRAKAKESGNLETTKEQTVTQEGSTIIVESSSPDVVYVPSYSPTVVYGGWAPPYSYYPPMYVAPPPGYAAMSFTVGMAWGAAIWGDCDWNSSDVDIDIDQHNEFNNRTDRNPERNRVDSRGGGNRSSFQHNPEHRRGVNYKDSTTAQRVGATGAGGRVSRDQARGYSSGATGRTGSAAEASAGRRTTGSTGSTSRGTTGSTASSRGSSASRSSSRSSSSALSGSSSPSMDRAASSRGASSRGSAGARSAGGGARMGGGGRGGGRGR
jgi:hypothetical protein